MYIFHLVRDEPFTTFYLSNAPFHPTLTTLTMSASYVARFIPLERLPLLAPAALARFRDLDAGLPFWSPSGSPWSSWVIPWAPLCWHISSHACANVLVAPSSDPALNVILFFLGLPVRSPFSLRGRRYILFALPRTLYILQSLCCLWSPFCWVAVLVAPSCDHA